MRGMAEAARPGRSGRARGWRRAAALPALASAVLVGLALVRLAGGPGDTVADVLERLGADARGRPTLLYLFHEEDCVRYGGLVRSWNAMHASGSVRVVGVALRVPEGRRAALGERLTPRPRFPIRFEAGAAAERLLLETGFVRTPAAMLLDGRGRLRLVAPAPARPARERPLASLVRAYARILAGEGREPA